jgi:hypothetical protein
MCREGQIQRLRKISGVSCNERPLNQSLTLAVCGSCSSRPRVRAKDLLEWKNGSGVLLSMVCQPKKKEIEEYCEKKKRIRVTD